MVGTHGPPNHRGRSLVLMFAAAFTLVLAGCGSTAALPGHGDASHLVGQDGPPADPAKVAVVRRWAAALRAGNLRGAAGYFHLPSLFDDGATQTMTIHTLAQAEFVNSTLPCGAKVVSAFRAGRFIDVLFRLTSRAGPGGRTPGCGSGVGETARTDFLIHDGQILEWLRAPSLPGDPGVPRAPSAPPRSGGGGAGAPGGGGLPA